MTQPVFRPQVPTCQIAPAPSNPNSWDDAKFAQLVQAIDDEGFNSVILLRAVSPPMDTEFTVYQVSDGEHRWRAAQEPDLEHVPAYVYPEGACSDAKARALQVGFNNLRGDMDLTSVAKALAEFDLAGMEHLTGYTAEGMAELTALLTPPSAEDLLGEGMTPPTPAAAEPEEPGTAAGVFELTISLASGDDVREVRKRLKKAGGKSKDMGRGLLKVLGIT